MIATFNDAPLRSISSSTPLLPIFSGMEIRAKSSGLPVAGAELQCQAGYVQRRGGAVDGNRMPGAGMREHGPLEFRNMGTLGEVEGFQHVDDGVHVVLPDVLLPVANGHAGRIVPILSMGFGWNEG